MSTIIETGIDYKKLDDTKYMRSYIMRLNDDLRYMLTNIDPEDNFDQESLESWMEYEGKVSGIAKTLEEITVTVSSETAKITSGVNQRSDELLLYVQSGDVTNKINNRLRIGTERIEIETSRLTVLSENFHLENNDLSVKGEIISDEGSFGGFQIVRDASGNPYLDAGSSGVISGGSLDGSIGIFKSFSCAGTASDRTTMSLNEASVNLRNCRITSTGMTFYGDMTVMGNLDVAKYVADTDTYTNRLQMFVNNEIKADQNIWVEVYSGTSDSGRVQCYSVYSYIAGGEYSDRDLKYDISEIDGKTSVEMIREMDPVHYELIEDDSKAMGFVAQDIVKLSEKYGDYGMIGMTEDGMYALSYSRFIPVMAAALKEIDRELHGID